MNCLKAERRIYVYMELTLREREETAGHIATCDSCRKIMERVKHEREMLRRLHQIPTSIPNESMIVGRIMNAVQEMQQKKPSLVKDFFPNPFSTALRYVMTALSLFLVVTFVSEHNVAVLSPPLQPSYRIKSGNKAELNSASFHDALMATREKNRNSTTSVYQCVMRCLANKGIDCTDCRTQFANLN